MKRAAWFFFFVLLGCSKEGGKFFQNTPPVAITTQEIQGMAGEFVYLDGTPSFDPDGDRIFYQWKIVEVPEGSKGILGDSYSPISILFLDVPGEFTVSFSVSDGVEESNPVTVKVLSQNIPLLPVAVIGERKISTEIMKEASAHGFLSFNPVEGELNYHWELKEMPSSSTGFVIDATSPVFRFLPDVPHGIYSAVLKVSNKYGESNTDYVHFFVKNRPPRAKIEGLILNTTRSGMSLSVSDNQTVDFGRYSSVSDEDSDVLSYQWRFTYTHKRGTFPVGHGFMCPSLGAGVFDTCPDPPSKVSFLDGISQDGEGKYVISVTISDGYDAIEKKVFLERLGAPPPSIRIDDKMVNHRFINGTYYAEERDKGNRFVTVISELKNLYTESVNAEWRASAIKLPSQEAPSPVIQPSRGTVVLPPDGRAEVPFYITIAGTKPSILGDYEFKFTACLSGTASCSSEIFKITITNLPPDSLEVPVQMTFTHSGCEEIEYGGQLLLVAGMPAASYTLSLSARDPDGDPLTFEFTYGNGTITNLIRTDGKALPAQISTSSGILSPNVSLCGLPWSCNFNWTWKNAVNTGKFTALYVGVKDPWVYGPSKTVKLYSLCP